MKRLCILWMAIFVLSGCGAVARQRQPEAFFQAHMITEGCRQRQLTGELNGYVAAARCSQGRVRQVIADSGYPHMDLIDLYLAYELALSQRVDQGKLSVAEANLRLSELRKRISIEEQRRNMVAYQPQPAAR